MKKFLYNSVKESADAMIQSELVGTDGNFSPICVSATAAASCRIESVSWLNAQNLQMRNPHQ